MKRVPGNWFRVTTQGDIALVRGFVHIGGVDSIRIAAAVATMRRMRRRRSDLRGRRTEVGRRSIPVEVVAAAQRAHGIDGGRVAGVAAGRSGREPAGRLGHVVAHGKRGSARLVEYGGARLLSRIEARERGIRFGGRGRLLASGRRLMAALLQVAVGRRVVGGWTLGMNRFSLVRLRRAGEAAVGGGRVVVGGGARPLDGRMRVARRIGSLRVDGLGLELGQRGAVLEGLRRLAAHRQRRIRVAGFAGAGSGFGARVSVLVRHRGIVLAEIAQLNSVQIWRVRIKLIIGRAC